MMSVASDTRITNSGDSEFGYVDRCHVTVSDFLVVEGWVYAPGWRYAERIALRIDDADIAVSTGGQKRVDAHQGRGKSIGPNCGFYFAVPVAHRPEHLEIRAASRSDTTTLRADLEWTTPGDRSLLRADVGKFKPTRLRALSV